MILEKQLIMTIGITANNWELTKEMVENSLDSFYLVPIVWNKRQEFKTYRDDYFTDYFEKCIAVGCISDCKRIEIVGNEVYADIVVRDEYNYLWKGKFDNWCIQPSDDKKSFKLCSIEVF